MPLDQNPHPLVLGESAFQCMFALINHCFKTIQYFKYHSAIHSIYSAFKFFFFVRLSENH